MIRTRKLKNNRKKFDRITADGPDIEKRISRNWQPPSLDEIVVSNCTVHLERMNNNHYYLGIWDDDTGLHISVGLEACAAKRKRGVKRTLIAYIYDYENLDGIQVDDNALGY